jgi:hypothetical protein
MLGVSLALHGLLAGGVALSFCRGAPQGSVEPVEETTTLTLIPPTLPPVRPSSMPSIAKLAALHLVTMSQPAALPAISAPRSPAVAPLITEKGLPVLPKTTPVVEANPNAHLPRVAPEAVLSPVPPPNLDGTKGVVFILDISGSMYEAYAGSTRLAYARQTLSRRVRALPDGTPFAVVLYAQRACPSGPLVAANDATREAAVRFLMRDVDCGGGTNLPAGLVAARALRTGALVLATDGDLNISVPNLMLESREILGGAGVGPSIEVVGIGPRAGTTADQLLQDLADQEGGSYGIEQLPDETASLAPASATR